jgi:hypothetical protein
MHIMTMTAQLLILIIITVEASFVGSLTLSDKILGDIVLLLLTIIGAGQILAKVLSIVCSFFNYDNPEATKTEYKKKVAVKDKRV